MDFNDQSANSFFLRVDKLRNDACWRPYQKEFDETRKKETREQLDQIMAPFFTSSQAKKANTWIEMMIAKNLHEIVFAETSGSLFQATCTTKKVYNDKCKLIRFGHDSKNKMLNDLLKRNAYICLIGRTLMAFVNLNGCYSKLM
ncbi:25252_t:CDS:2, partial [Gigaspora margarita]